MEVRRGTVSRAKESNVEQSGVSQANPSKMKVPLPVLSLFLLASLAWCGAVGRFDCGFQSCLDDQLCEFVLLDHLGVHVTLNNSFRPSPVSDVWINLWPHCMLPKFCPRTHNTVTRCCNNETDCADAKRDMLDSYKYEPSGNGSLTCSAAKEFVKIDDDKQELYITLDRAAACKTDQVCVAQTKYQQELSPYFPLNVALLPVAVTTTSCEEAADEESPCKQHGVENGCVRWFERGWLRSVCCCSNRHYCTGYAPTLDTFDKAGSTARWPTSARPHTLRCVEQDGQQWNATIRTSAETSCEGSACASVGYVQDDAPMHRHGCVAKADCERVFGDLLFGGCGKLNYDGGSGWLCCCSNGDYCNLNKFDSTPPTLMLANVTAPLSPLSTLAELVKAARVHHVAEPVNWTRDGVLWPRRGEPEPTTTTTTTTTTRPTTLVPTTTMAPTPPPTTVQTQTSTQTSVKPRNKTRRRPPPPLLAGARATAACGRGAALGIGATLLLLLGDV